MPASKGDAGQHDARTAARIGGDGKVHQVESAKARKSPGERDRENLDQAASDKEDRQHSYGQASHQIKLQSHDCEIHGDEEGKRDFGDGVQRIGEEPALLVYDGKASQERGKDQAHVERSRHYAVGQEHGDGIGHGRLLCEDVEARFVDSLDRAGEQSQSQNKERDRRQQMTRQGPGIECGIGGEGGSDGECEPEDNVFQHGHAEHQAREAGMQDFQVGKNLGHYGNGGDRDSRQRER